MAKDNETKTDVVKKSNKFDAVKSIAWLIEAAFRGFAGWVLLTNFHNYATTVAAVYALATGAVIVITHFVKAHK